MPNNFDRFLFTFLVFTIIILIVTLGFVLFPPGPTKPAQNNYLEALS